MIAKSYFEGDENETLKWIQADSCEEISSFLFHYAAHFYLTKSYTARKTPDFVRIIARISGVDHCVFDEAHDIIAAYYRYAFCPHQDIHPIPERFDMDNYYREAWSLFFYSEAANLAKIEEIAHAVCTAVAYAHTERSSEALQHLTEMLNERYSMKARIGDASRIYS